MNDYQHYALDAVQMCSQFPNMGAQVSIGIVFLIIVLNFVKSSLLMITALCVKGIYSRRAVSDLQ